MRRAQEELATVPVADIVANHAVGLWQLAVLHLTPPPGPDGSPGEPRLEEATSRSTRSPPSSRASATASAPHDEALARRSPSSASPTSRSATPAADPSARLAPRLSSTPGSARPQLARLGGAERAADDPNVTVTPTVMVRGAVGDGSAVEGKRYLVGLDLADPRFVERDHPAVDDAARHRQWTILAMGSSMMPLAPASLSAGSAC